MTLVEIKKAVEVLSPTERSEVLAFLVRRRLLEDPSYRAAVDRRSADSDPSHWLKQRPETCPHTPSPISGPRFGTGGLVSEPRSQAPASHETEHRQRS
jgi:hypothetical protein